MWTSLWDTAGRDRGWGVGSGERSETMGGKVPEQMLKVCNPLGGEGEKVALG